MAHISVIIPVYNAEKTLRRCLDSVLSQTRQADEIVAVNDGSTDSSAVLLQEYAEKYSSIRVVTQQNQGVSAARNAGIDAATGEWVLFVDADDYLDADALEILAADRSGEMSLAGLTIHTAEKTYKQPLFRSGQDKKTGAMSAKEGLDIMSYYTFCGPVCKLFRADIIKKNNICFPLDMHFGEDTVFVYRYLKYVQRLTVSDTHVYHCDKGNERSLTATVDSAVYYNSMKRIYPVMREAYESHGVSVDYADYVYLDALQAATHMSYKDGGMTAAERRDVYKTMCMNAHFDSIKQQCSPMFVLFGRWHAWHLCEWYMRMRNKK